MNTQPALTNRILVVDDDALLRKQLDLQLSRLGYDVVCAENSALALKHIKSSSFGAIVSDVHMPCGDGIALLKSIRTVDHHVPVLLLTGEPTMDTAIEAVALGAYRYLRKPVDMRELKSLLGEAIRVHRLRQRHTQNDEAAEFETPEGEALFESILETVYMAYQPLVQSTSDSPASMMGVEALLRAKHPRYTYPGQLIAAAEALDRLDDLGVVIRSNIRADIPQMPSAWKVFINLHPLELSSQALLECARQFPNPERIVFEITERVRLREVNDPRGSIDTLRSMGYQIAVDDLGEGYSSVNSLTLLEPEYVKLDMSLIRDIHMDRRRKTMVGGLVAVCRSMGAEIVAEGVETINELHALHHLNCDYLQGYFFARPMALEDLLQTAIAKAPIAVAAPPPKPLAVESRAH